MMKLRWVLVVATAAASHAEAQSVVAETVTDSDGYTCVTTYKDFIQCGGTSPHSAAAEVPSTEPVTVNASSYCVQLGGNVQCFEDQAAYAKHAENLCREHEIPPDILLLGGGLHTFTQSPEYPEEWAACYKVRAEVEKLEKSTEAARLKQQQVKEEADRAFVEDFVKGLK